MEQDEQNVLDVVLFLCFGNYEHALRKFLEWSVKKGVRRSPALLAEWKEFLARAVLPRALVLLREKNIKKNLS